MILPSNTALLVVDVQRAIDNPSWAADRPRNNPGAEANIAALLANWRRLGFPIFHVKHDGTFPTSTYRPGQPGNDFKPEAAPLPGEAIIIKHTNSAFIGTELDRLLRRAKISTLVICGVITNNSVETTVRMAGNLGFETYLVEDAGLHLRPQGLPRQAEDRGGSPRYVCREYEWRLLHGYDHRRGAEGHCQ